MQCRSPKNELLWSGKPEDAERDGNADVDGRPCRRPSSCKLHAELPIFGVITEPLARTAVVFMISSPCSKLGPPLDGRARAEYSSQPQDILSVTWSKMVGRVVSPSIPAAPSLAPIKNDLAPSLIRFQSVGRRSLCPVSPRPHAVFFISGPRLTWFASRTRASTNCPDGFFCHPRQRHGSVRRRHPEKELRMPCAVTLDYGVAHHQRVGSWPRSRCTRLPLAAPWHTRAIYAGRAHEVSPDVRMLQEFSASFRLW